MKFRNKVVSIFLGSLILISCGGGDKSSSGMNEMDASYNGAGYESLNAAPTADNSESTAVDASVQTEVLARKLIKTATISFEVDSLKTRETLIDKAIQKFNGYIEREENYSNYERQYADVTVRVPAQNFDGFIKAAIAGVGDFETKTVKVEDVSEEYVDVASRIETKKALKERFIVLLDRAESIPEIVEVEREINAIQEEIEAFESRLNFMGRNARYSTVTLSYFIPLSTVPEVKDNAFAKAFNYGWEGFVLLLVGLTAFWPILLSVTLVLVILRIRVKRKRAKAFNQ